MDGLPCGRYVRGKPESLMRTTLTGRKKCHCQKWDVDLSELVTGMLHLVISKERDCQGLRPLACLRIE
jgi:hypothetical protein